MEAKGLHRKLRVPMTGAVLAMAFAVPAIAQVGAPSDDDLLNAPPQFREKLSGGELKPDASEFDNAAENLAPPSDDPRDMNGVYSNGRVRFDPAPLPGTEAAIAALPKPEGPGGPGGRPPGGGSTGEAACAMSFPRLVSYSTTIMINDKTALLLSEENHGLRWARFEDAHPASVEPSYQGHSIARWDGDTLVIDTVGIKVRGQDATDHVLERFTKLDDGNVRIEAYKVNADGLPVPDSGAELRWRPDLSYVEDICEDFGEAFGVNYE